MRRGRQSLHPPRERLTIQPVRTVLVLVLVLVVLVGCSRGGGGSLDAGAVEPPVVMDAGWTLSPQALDSWLRWQSGLRGASSPGDGGVRRASGRQRARLEADLLAEAGLSFDEVDLVEDVVAAVVTQWHVDQLVDSDLRGRVAGALGELSEAQRREAEALLASASSDAGWAHSAARAALEARFGAGSLHALEARRQEVTSAWDALMDPRGRGP